MSDRREQDHRWFDSFDERAMTVTLEGFDAETGEDLVVPVKYEVCGTCDGKGSHVNPSIDSHGIGPEEFDEDPDFAESYFRGDYDIPCAECHGRRVSVELDEARAGKALSQQIYDYLADRASYAAECAAERRMGA